MRLLYLHILWFTLLIGVQIAGFAKVPDMWLWWGVGLLPFQMVVVWLAVVRYVEYRRVAKILRFNISADFIQDTWLNTALVYAWRVYRPLQFSTLGLWRISTVKGRQRAVAYAFYRVVQKKTMAEYVKEAAKMPLRNSGNLWSNYFWPANF